MPDPRVPLQGSDSLWPAGRRPPKCPGTCSCTAVCGWAVIEGRYTLRWESGLSAEGTWLRRLAGKWLVDRARGKNA